MDKRYSKFIVSRNDINSLTLAHHGILGQKWGSMNGPPYPLDYEAHSSSEKKKNPKSLIDGDSKTTTGKKNSILNKAFGFDLSKYSYKGGTKTFNCSDNFKDFSGLLNKLIEAYGKEGAANFLKEKYGFSEDDAKAAVKNLNKAIKATEGESSKTGSGKSGSSKSSSKESESEATEEVEEPQEPQESASELDQELGFDASTCEFEDPETGETTNLEDSFDKFMSIMDKDYADWIEYYESLDETEKQRLQEELGVSNAEEFAQYTCKDMLSETYGFPKENSDAIMKKFNESRKLNDIVGFDLSKYHIYVDDKKTSLREGFDTFSDEIKEMLDRTKDPEGTMEYLQSDYLFSKEDAQSIVDNLQEAMDYRSQLQHSANIALGMMFTDTLIHHGIDGQKWGIQNGPPYPLDQNDYSKSEKKALKQDLKWIKKNEKKVYNKAYKESKKELDEYAGLLSQKYGLNKNGKLSAAYVNNFNKGMAALMNEKVEDISSPSGRAVRFIAKRGQMGVYTALADQGYDMNQVKNGVWTSGRIAYRKTGVTKVDVGED